jgi:hypothetical protein
MTSRPLGSVLGVFFFACATVLAAAGCATAQGTPSRAESAPQPPAGEPQPGDAASEAAPQDTYTQEETLDAAKKFFGGTSAGLAKAIEKVFSENGRPVGYIIGEEGSGAVVVGLRYGSGTLKYKNGGTIPVYWQGPSVGFDFGGNASKVFTLVYNLHWTRDIFQKFPGVDGSLYVVAGVGLNYLRANDITLAPIRTGVGLRAGASVGYLTFTREKSYNPF